MAQSLVVLNNVDNLIKELNTFFDLTSGSAVCYIRDNMAELECYSQGDGDASKEAKNSLELYCSMNNLVFKFNQLLETIDSINNQALIDATFNEVEEGFNLIAQIEHSIWILKAFVLSEEEVVCYEKNAIGRMLHNQSPGIAFDSRTYH